MRKKYLLFVLPLCMLAVLPACGKQKTAQVSDEINVSQSEQSYTYFGSLKAAAQADVIPNGKGQIISCPFETGDAVNQGDLLYQLDDNGLADSISTAKNSIAKADISIATDKENVANLKIYAPASGILRNFDVKLNERVNASKIGEIIDEQSMIAKIPFNQTQKSKISVGDKALISSGDFMSSISGTVSKISDGKSDLSVGGSVLYDIEIKFANPGGFAEGQSVSAKITNKNGSFSSPEAGVVQNSEAVSVVSRASGNAIRVCAAEGDYVKKGSLLVETENSTVTDTLKRAELDRKDLQIKLASLEKDYADLFIYAPMSGIIISKNKSNLDNITSNNKSIMTIADTSEMLLNLSVSEDIAGKLKENMQLAVLADGRQITGVVQSVQSGGTVSGSSVVYPVTICISGADDLTVGGVASVDFGGLFK